MNKILKLFEFFRLYFFAIFSNISPNQNIRSNVIIFIKSAFYNLKYSYKNIFEPSNDKKFEFSKGSYWNRCINHLNFIEKYFDINQIHKAPVLQLTVLNFSSGFNKKLENNFFSNNKLLDYSKFLLNIFNDVNSKSMLYWFGSFYYTFESDTISNTDKKIIMNSHVLEIGPGLGLNSLIYSDFNSKKIFYFDLNSMLRIQKKIEKKIKKTHSINEIIYSDDVAELEKTLENKEYYIVSRYAFSEFPIYLRNKFEKLIKNSKFSLFLANVEFENVKNEKYFQDLAKKIQKNLVVKDYYYPEQDNFTKKHKYFILND